MSSFECVWFNRRCQRRRGVTRRRGRYGHGRFAPQGSPAGRTQEPSLPRSLSVSRAQAQQPAWCRHMSSKPTRTKNEKMKEDKTHKTHKKAKELATHTHTLTENTLCLETQSSGTQDFIYFLADTHTDHPLTHTHTHTYKRKKSLISVTVLFFQWNFFVCLAAGWRVFLSSLFGSRWQDKIERVGERREKMGVRRNTRRLTALSEMITIFSLGCPRRHRHTANAQFCFLCFYCEMLWSFFIWWFFTRLLHWWYYQDLHRCHI